MRVTFAALISLCLIVGFVFATIADEPPSAGPIRPSIKTRLKKAAESVDPPAPPPNPTRNAAPAVDAEGESVVWALAYATFGDGSVAGTCSPVYIKVGGRAANQVRVGFFESEVSGTGHQWRAAGWAAALMAAQLTDFDPRAMQVSFDYEGRIDGPSAGCLMTIGVLSAVRGDKMRDNIAMTGTINPDGTIGPVGGIPYKLEGAARQGKKIVLIPAGLRIQTKDDGTEYDLIAHGKELGIEVHPVVDVYAAYKYFTGVDLPRPPEAGEPETTATLDTQIREKTSEWLARFQTALDDVQKRPEQTRAPEALDLLQKGADLLTNIPALQNEGEFGVAYWDSVEATARAYLADEACKDVHMAVLKGRKGMADRVRDNNWLKDEVSDAAARLRLETPKTLDQLPMYLTACSCFFEAISMQYVAQSALDGVPEEPDEKHDSIVLAASGNQIIAYLDLQLTGDQLDFMGKVIGGPPIPADAPFGTVADYYSRAGEANMAVFDSLVSEPNSNAWHMSVDEAKLLLQSKDSAYAAMSGAQHVVQQTLPKYFGQGEPYLYGRLAAGLFTYPYSAGLIAKYYSLGAQLDKNLQVVSLSRERTFGDWLDTLEDRTRRSVGFLQSKGLSMPLAAQQYQISHVRRGRDLQARLRALNDLLFCYTQSECVRRLAGYRLSDPAP